MKFQYQIVADDPNERLLLMAAYDRKQVEDPGWGHRVPKPVAADPPIPFHAVPADEYRAEGPFDIVTVCRSPDYAPAAADAAFDMISEYIADDLRTA